MLMIASPGRAVHYYNPEWRDVAAKPDGAGPGFNGVGAGPYHAVVTQVFKNELGAVTYANLYVTPPFGEPFHVGSVAEEGSAYHHDGGAYWTWPPRF